MINIFVAYDKQDAHLGGYFESCKNQLFGVLAEHDELFYENVHEISGHQCNHVYIDLTIPLYNVNPFIFIAYSHGDEKSLFCEKNSYVEKDVNAHLFTNSLFYTTACSAGKELGRHLVEQGCLTFVGYEKTINKYQKDDKKEISINCDNFGIIAFLLKDITIFEAYFLMKKNYTQQIDRLNNVKDILFAADLVEARDALVCLGDKNLKKEDLFLSK